LSGPGNFRSKTHSLRLVGAARFRAGEIGDGLQPFLERVCPIRWSHLSHAIPARCSGSRQWRGDHSVSCVGSWPDPFAQGSPVSGEMSVLVRVKLR
jgi:hypothetical protein